MAASERHILVVSLIEKAMVCVMDIKVDDMHVECFEHTGYLIIFIANKGLDLMVKP